MKVEVLLLLKDGTHDPGLVTFPMGYAQNLFKKRIGGQKVAVYATPNNIKHYEKQIILNRKKDEEMFKEYSKAVDQLSGQVFFLPLPSNENGILYGTVKAKDIVKIIRSKFTQLTFLNNSHIVVESIRKPGVYCVKVDFGRGKELIQEVFFSIANSESDAVKQYDAFLQETKLNNGKPDQKDNKESKKKEEISDEESSLKKE